MKIGKFDLEEDVLVIAEIGNNHEGSYSLAEEMIGLAANSGADAVKFQVIVPEKLVSIKDEVRYEQLKKFQFSYKEFEKLRNVSLKEGVMFLATPFDVESAIFLKSLVPAFKISSGDINFYPMIEVIASTGKPILLSTGLANLDLISTTKNFIERKWRDYGFKQEMSILHCVSSYPVSFKEANLNAIRTLQEYFKVTVGYSDHTIGIEAAVMSAVLGVRIIEKHFTINNNFSNFRDHKLSANPKDFAQMVERIKKSLEMLGDGAKSLQENEKKTAIDVFRSIAAKKDLKKGHILTWSDLEWIRPGKGVPPGQEQSILGRTLKRQIEKGELLTLDDVYGKLQKVSKIS